MRSFVKLATFLLCCIFTNSANSDVWLSPDSHLKSDFKDQSPQACQIQSIMQTEQGPIILVSKMIAFDKSIGGVGVVFSAALRKQSGEVLPFIDFSRNTSVGLSNWKYLEDTKAFALTGSEATRYVSEYTKVSMKFSGWVSGKGSFDPTRDFIFLVFGKENDFYHAPLFLGNAEPKFSVCVTKSLTKLLSEMQ